MRQSMRRWRTCAGVCSNDISGISNGVDFSSIFSVVHLIARDRTFGFMTVSAIGSSPQSFTPRTS
jgi:hypothetical protein